MIPIINKLLNIKGPRILVWDIETGYNVAHIFSLYVRNGMIPSYAIQQERYIICAAYKILGETKVYATSLLDDKSSFKLDPTNDYAVVKHIHEVLSNVDAIVHHYGDKFDIKFFNTRAAYHGLPPLPDIVQIDTHKICKAKFMFNSNKLDYVGNFLGLGRKIETHNTLWERCFRGEVKAVREMVTYNKQDVLLLEEVYLYLRPYVPAKLNHNLFTGAVVCSHCGSYNIVWRGLRPARTRVYRRYVCKDCGAWGQSTKSESHPQAEVK